MLEPVGAGTIAWVLLGESLSRVQILGTLIVLVGIVLAETARQSATPPPEEQEEQEEQEASTRHTEGASPLPEGMAP